MRDDLTSFRTILRRELPALAVRYGVASLELFGSYVRRENQPGSDLDVLVTFRNVPSLLKLIDLENNLSDLLGVKVDLVMRDALKPHLRDQVFAEVIPI
jgi:predicted nucleotidyltransferase